MKLISILDHGSVQLIEHWGSDERVIEAARQSTGKGFLGWESDEKLLAYLYNNKHSTPFEMCGLTIQVKAPIFVFREWHRHRTQCLAGDTQICCVTPNGTTFHRTIKEIFQLKHGGVVDNMPAKHKNGTSKIGTPVFRDARRKDEWRTRILPNCQNRLLRVYNETTGEFEVAPMSSVWESGVKTIYALETRGGHLIKASAEHPFLTKRGWVKLKDLEIGDEIAKMGKVAAQKRPIPPALRNGIGVWTTMMRTRLINPVDNCYLCGQEFRHKDLELDHVIPVYENLKLALDERNLRAACAPCHRIKTNMEQPSKKGKTKRGVRWENVDSLPVIIGEEMTYDIEVSGENHNYVANGLVVHNSYNEMSGRYVPLPDEHYLPSISRIMDGANTVTSNKQAQGVSKEPMGGHTAACVQVLLRESYRVAQENYVEMLALGTPKELARLVIPVARYSTMMASANLRNWLAFLTLRNAPNAQWEIQEYAKAVDSILTEIFPRTMELFHK